MEPSGVAVMAEQDDYCTVTRERGHTTYRAGGVPWFRRRTAPEPEAEPPTPLEVPTAQEVWLFAPDFRKFGRAERHLWHLCHLHTRVQDTPVRFPGVRSLKHACLHAALMKQNATSANLLAALREHSGASASERFAGLGGVPGSGLPRWIEGRLEAPRVIGVVPQHKPGTPAPRPRRAWEREGAEAATLTPETAVRVVYGSYRIVLCIELSPSLLMLANPQSARCAPTPSVPTPPTHRLKKRMGSAGADAGRRRTCCTARSTSPCARRCSPSSPTPSSPTVSATPPPASPSYTSRSSCAG